MTDAPAPRTPFRAWIGAALFATALAAAAAGALYGLYARAAQAPGGAAATPPLPVRVARLAFQEGFTIRERFVGRIEPARSVRPAFERAGKVVAVLIEEGRAVAEGAALARLDTGPLEIARRRLAASRAALEADLALAEATLSRSEELNRRGFETGQTLDEARFRAAALEARIAATEAEIAQIDLDREKSVLRAPFDGVLAARHIDEGAVLAAGAELGLFQETGRPQARIGLPPGPARAFAPGDAATLETPAGPAAATVVAVAPDVDPATRTVSVLFDLPPDAPVAMGDVVRLTRDRRVAGRGAWAPLSALEEGERGLWTVYALAPGPDGGTVARRSAVVALHVSEGRAFIRGPLPDGAGIVVEGLTRLAPGQRVAQIAE